MADDRTLRGAADRSRINMQEDYEVRYWTQKWNVSREQLAAAVREVGVMAADVARKLGSLPPDNGRSFSKILRRRRAARHGRINHAKKRLAAPSGLRGGGRSLPRRHRKQLSLKRTRCCEPECSLVRMA